MKLLTMFIGVLSICGMLSTEYDYKMYKTCELSQSNNVNIVENSIYKNEKYIKEDLKIPQFKGNLKALEEVNMKIKNDIMPKLNEAEKAAEEYYKNSENDVPAFPFEVNSQYTITENNDYLISLYNDYYEFLGGAHGITIRTSYNIEKKSGKMLKLSDLFKEGYDYKSVINSYIRKQIENNQKDYFESSDKFKGISDDQGYYISGSNIIIYYQQYEIAPYAGGIREFRIPLDHMELNYKL